MFSKIKTSISKKLFMAMVGLILTLISIFTIVQISAEKKIFEEELKRRITIMEGKVKNNGNTNPKALLEQEIQESRLHKEEHYREAILESIAFALVCLFFGSLLAFYGARRITGPLGQLMEFSQKLAIGDFSAAVSEEITGSDDEIGELSRTFVHMARELEASQAKLEEYNRTLEQKIDGRTIELKDALKVVRKTHEDLKMSQEQLIQSEKFASLGQLTAGVAHEINTPVGVSVTAASFLLEQVRKLKEAFSRSELQKAGIIGIIQLIDESSELVLSNLQRASELVASLRQTSADQTSQEKRSFDLRQVISDTLITLKPRLKRRHTIVNLECPENLMMNSFPGALSQVVANLAINSLDHAFDDGALAEIKITVVETNANHVKIKFSDNGKGIPEEIRGKIFEPFFTTKRGSGGTGLGLFIVYNIVRQALKGEVRCESALGKGTFFEIILPKGEAVTSEQFPFDR